MAAGFVEAIDVMKEGIGNILACCPTVTPDQFGFNGFEEGLDGCIVVAVSSAAHRHFEANFAHPLLIVMGAILTTPVRVMDAALWRVSMGNSIVQCLQRQITFQMIVNRPTDDPA